MNFITDILDRLPADKTGLIALAADGIRSEFSFGELSELSAKLAGYMQAEHDIQQGDTVMTVIGNRPEWILTMLACFRIGAIALPCNEQLRSKDLQHRVDTTQPKLILADRRNAAELEQTNYSCPTVFIPEESVFTGPPVQPVGLDPEDPCLITFTSGTASQPKAVLHGQRYLTGQNLQADHWLGAGPDTVVWCTATSGWSKSARNVFIAPWLRGATALIHDGRFDAEERLTLLEREAVNVLCMAPTEYRLIAKQATIKPLPSLKRVVAAGEALNPEVISNWNAATGLTIQDGYGQTETGHITYTPPDEAVRPGSMGKFLPGIKGWLEDGELVLDPKTIPTFFLNYLGEEIPKGNWHTGDRLREDSDGFLYFEGRSDDVIISSGYRIGPFEVESALVSHPAVAEAAVVAEPDPERGSIVKAVVVLRTDVAANEDLKRELQNHVKAETAPYKYPRVVEFTQSLPKTASGKIKRAELRSS